MRKRFRPRASRGTRKGKRKYIWTGVNNGGFTITWDEDTPPATAFEILGQTELGGIDGPDNWNVNVHRLLFKYCALSSGTALGHRMVMQLLAAPTAADAATPMVHIPYLGDQDTFRKSVWWMDIFTVPRNGSYGNIWPETGQNATPVDTNQEVDPVLVAGSTTQLSWNHLMAHGGDWVDLKLNRRLDHQRGMYMMFCANRSQTGEDPAPYISFTYRVLYSVGKR